MTKEVLKQALEALETSMYPQQKQLQAITAIKSALANEALERKAENARELGLDYEPLEAKDEPVAWMYEVNHAHTCLDLFEPPDDAYDEGTLYPLYTTPPQRTWVGLTDEEIVLIVAECSASHQHTDIHFARAIEAKLKEKNCG